MAYFAPGALRWPRGKVAWPLALVKLVTVGLFPAGFEVSSNPPPTGPPPSGFSIQRWMLLCLWRRSRRPLAAWFSAPEGDKVAL